MTIRATVRSVKGKNDSERLEIHVPVSQADGLPYRTGKPVEVKLEVDGTMYNACIRSTQRNAYVWISPKLFRDGVRFQLVHVLQSAGFQKNEAVELIVDDHSLILNKALA